MGLLESNVKEAVEVLVKIDKNGELRIPDKLVEAIGAESGEVSMKLAGGKLIIEPVEDPLEQLTGILKTNENIEELIESEEWY